MSNERGGTAGETEKRSEQSGGRAARGKGRGGPAGGLEDARAVDEAGMRGAKAAQAALEDAEQRIEAVSVAHSDS